VKARETPDRRRLRVAVAAGLAWLAGVATWYYVGTLLAL
jgi:hypothetical protein